MTQIEFVTELEQALRGNVEERKKAHAAHRPRHDAAGDRGGLAPRTA